MTATNPAWAEFDSIQLPFTKFFNPAAERFIADKENPAVNRVYAWIKRKAWGNRSPHCVKSLNDRTALLQRDCAADLDLNKATVSKAIAKLERRGYLDLDSPYLTPLMNPESPGATDPIDDNDSFQEFVDGDFKVSNPETWGEMKTVDAEIKSLLARQKALRKFARDEYRKLPKRQPDAAENDHGNFEFQSPQPPNKEEERTEEVRTDVPPAVPETPERETPRAAASDPLNGKIDESEPPGIRDELRIELIRRGSDMGLYTSPDDDVLGEINTYINDKVSLDRFLKQLQTQKPKAHSWKYLVPIARKVRLNLRDLAADRPIEQQPKPSDSVNAAALPEEALDEIERAIRGDDPAEWERVKRKYPQWKWA